MKSEDLADRLDKEGGFSVSAFDRMPHSGTMVSRFGTEETVPGIASAEDIEAYRNKHAEALGRRGYYFGGWIEDTSQGKQTVFDVSQRFPSGHADAANLQGVIHSQRALFDVDKGDAHQTIPVLPMDYSHLDITDVPHPKFRHASELSGRRSPQVAMEQLHLPRIH